MTDKELRKLKRRDLLEILYDQAEEIERLEAENKELKQRLDDRRILVEKTGTMAEAALALNAVFEAADAAAKQYLENVRAGCQEDAEAEAAPEDGSGGEVKKKKETLTGESEKDSKEETPTGEGKKDSKKETPSEKDVDDSKEETLPEEDVDDSKEETLTEKDVDDSKEETLSEEDEKDLKEETLTEKGKADLKKPASPGKSETGQAEETPENVPWIEG